MGASYRVTPEMWQVWTESDAAIPGVRLGGIYANKRYYHSSVEENLAKWAPNYSIRVSLDLKGGNRHRARAIDLTMSGTEMRKRTRYLRDSALNPDDDRLAAMREFYGTLDGRNVYGLIKDDEDGPWEWSTSDSSHLWHIHAAFFAAFVASSKALAGFVSVISGESLASWRRRTGGASLPTSGRIARPPLEEGDEGPEVGKLQSNLNEAIGAGLAEDEDFGPRTGDALEDFQRAAGITPDRIYGPVSAEAMRTALEDDMDLDDKINLRWDGEVKYSAKTTTVGGILTSTNYYTLQARDRILTELASARKRDEAILAAVEGLDTEAILERIDQRATEDAQRDAELATLVEAAQSGRLEASAVVDEIAKRLGLGA